MFDRPGAASVTFGPASAEGRRLHANIWTVLTALSVAYALDWLFRRGMFWDGAVYATIARNLALGLGDLWHPQVTDTFMHTFREHPPLAFWLQALWFRILGDHLWVERAYSVTTGLVTAGLMIGVWRRLFAGRPQVQSCAWLPVGLWLTCASWSYLHNMLENTLAVFTTCSIYATLRAADRATGSALVAAGGNQRDRRGADQRAGRFVSARGTVDPRNRAAA